MAGPTGERPVLLPSAYGLHKTGESITLSVELAGKTVSSRNLLREARTADIAEQHLALSDTGFIGTYFVQPNLPARTAVLLEHFVNTLNWLRAQAAVDPQRVLVSLAVRRP
jgi:hypothetical protein